MEGGSGYFALEDPGPVRGSFAAEVEYSPGARQIAVSWTVVAVYCIIIVPSWAFSYYNVCYLSVCALITVVLLLQYNLFLGDSSDGGQFPYPCS